MMRVLFVDDEPNVLGGLRRMLRPMRRDWDMVFAENGQAALKSLADKPCDIVVSDMRMPGMDGVQLLGEVKERYPDTIRLALSGHSEMEMLLECARVAHQYLAKPCDPDTLRTTINRASALRNLLTDGRLIELISRIDSLPSLPKLYMEITEELASEDASVGRVADIISRDVAMTAKILQVVNSAFFGLPTHVGSPAQAAVMLGLDVLTGLVLSSKVFSQFEHAESGLDIEAIQRHSEQVGALAKRIAETGEYEPKTCDYALMAGMLQDVGRLVLANHCPKEYARVTGNPVAASHGDWTVEHQVFGCTHMEVGAYLLGAWGLPNPIVEAVAYHHDPNRSVGTEFTPLTAVHVANALLETGNEPGNLTAHLDLDYLQRLGLSGSIPSWQELAAILMKTETNQP